MCIVATNRHSVLLSLCSCFHQAHEDGSLQQLLSGESYDYDLIVIGGGSGGLACSKVRNALKVAPVKTFIAVPVALLSNFVVCIMSVNHIETEAYVVMSNHSC